jgi:VWFA-related protein
MEGRINLDVVVTDASGKPVSGLGLNDFTLLDNNQPAKILSFHAVEAKSNSDEPPVEVILLIDRVNLDANYVAFERQEVEKFLVRNGGHLAQPVSIFDLTSSGLEVARAPSTDGTALATQVRQLSNNLRSVGLAGGLNGAIERFYSSLKVLAAIAQSESAKPGRKLLIWLGPGWPMLNSVGVHISSSGQRENFKTIVGLSAALREARLSLYSVSAAEGGVRSTVYRDFVKGVKSAGKSNPDNLALRVLAIQTGGRVLGPDNDLAGQIESCVQDAGAFYELSFDSARADQPDQYHDLKVTTRQGGPHCAHQHRVL